MIIITDSLNYPFDEGAKVTALNLIRSYKKKYPCDIITININCKLPFDHNNFRLNKLLFNKTFYNNIRFSQHNKILYIPNASITPATFVRAKLLRFYTGKEVNILSLQPVKYSFPAKIMVSAICPTSVIIQSSILAKKLERLGIKTSILALGVDDKKFRECDRNKKKELRKTYSLDLDNRIVLHVGHIKRSRNIEWLIEVKRRLPDVTILVVGNTTTVQDEEFRILIEKEGLIAMRGYIAGCIDNIARKADLMVVTSPTLHDKYINKTKKCVLVPNGFDEKLFDGKPKPVPSALKNIKRPIAGFVGVLLSFLDYELLYETAKGLSDISFVFVGPTEKSGKEGVEKLKTLSNTHFLGRKAKKDIPGYVTNFDICLNPFKVDNVSKAVSPLKIYEYLACGKTVISTPMEGLARENAGKLITFVNPDSFKENIREYFDKSSSCEINRQYVDAAWEYSWTSRFNSLYQHLEAILWNSN